MRLHAIRGHAQNTVESTREQFDLGFFRRRHYGGVRHTSPSFHDNSAKTLGEVVDHYADVFFRQFSIAGVILELTEQDGQDIVAFLEGF